MKSTFAIIPVVFLHFLFDLETNRKLCMRFKKFKCSVEFSKIWLFPSKLSTAKSNLRFHRNILEILTLKDIIFGFQKSKLFWQKRRFAMVTGNSKLTQIILEIVNNSANLWKMFMEFLYEGCYYFWMGVDWL